MMETQDSSSIRGLTKYNKAAKRKQVIVGVLVGTVLAVLVGVAVGVPLSRRSAAEDVAHKVLEEVPLVDGHNDLAWQIYLNTQNTLSQVNLRESLIPHWNITHTDIPRLKQGKVGAQFWAVYADCIVQYNDAVRACLDQVDVIKRFIHQYDDTFELVTTAKGIRTAFNRNRIGSMLGLEGGHCIDSSLATLRMFYDIGVRYMTITHNCNTPWADNWQVDLPDNPHTKEFDGLSPFGEEVIKEMNYLGMLVDLSHVSQDTMRDALNISTAPIIFSHTSSFARCNHYRNAPDDVLTLTTTNGGVVMVNFYDVYINCYPNNQTVAIMDQVIEHIEHIRDVAGIDHVGIGADYDGVPTLPEGLEDVSTYPALFTRLAERGWPEDHLKKLAGENIIRVFEKAEEVSRDLRSRRQPSDELLPPAAVKGAECRTTWEERKAEDL